MEQEPRFWEISFDFFIVKKVQEEIEYFSFSFTVKTRILLLEYF